MPLNLLSRFYFTQAPDATNFPAWVATSQLKVYWDDSLQTITASLYDSSGLLIGTGPQTSGPNLSIASLNLFVRTTDYKFQFCGGQGQAATTLTYFTLNNNTFPYMVLNRVENSNVCQTLVCDLALINVATTPATGALNADGTATVNASTTHGTKKYKLNAIDFDYSSATDSQLSNIFTGLNPGTYSFCVKDQYLCKVTGIFVVGNSDTYVERWKSDFRDVKSNAVHRISIEDRQFVGTSTDIKMVISAAQLEWRGEASEDTFAPVIPSQLQAALLSETDGQFANLFSSDERRFKLKKYINTGSGFTLQWVGFVTPMLYTEPYLESTNYPISVIATDQIGNLSNYQFLNDQNLPFTTRITYMEGICTILRKTGMQLNIKESVNLFETTMAQTATDSMLTQATFDPDVYKDADGTYQDCLKVLKSLIVNVGSRLYQDNGVWNIDFIEQKSATSIAYRIFTYLGVYSSNSSYDPTINMGNTYFNNRVVPYDNSVSMNITQNYGTFKFTYKLGLVNNFLRGGDMEVVDNTGSNPTLKGWSSDMSNAPGVSYGLEKLDEDNKGSLFAAFFDFKNSPMTAGSERGVFAILQSDSFTYTVNGLGRFQLMFDVYTRPVSSDCYIYIDYEVRMGGGSYYLDTDGFLTDGQRRMTTTPGPLLGSGANYATSPEFNRVISIDNLTWKTIQINFWGEEAAMTGQAYVKLRVCGNPFYEYSSLANLQGAVTADGKLMAQSPKARVLDGSVLRYYTLNAGSDATSSPDKLRPTDWSGGNPMFWKLDKSSTVPVIPTPPNNWLQSILIDNVKLLYLPVGKAPVENVYYNQITNSSIIQSLAITFSLGDLPYVPSRDVNGNLILDTFGNPVNSGTIDSNYKYLAKGHLELTNGTPTVNWKRSYMSQDSVPLVQLLQYLYIGQYQAPKYKLSGTFGYDLPVSFANTVYEARTGKRFMPNAMNLKYADSSMDAELLELKQGASSPAPDLFAFSTGFSSGFN